MGLPAQSIDFYILMLFERCVTTRLNLFQFDLGVSLTLILEELLRLRGAVVLIQVAKIKFLDITLDDRLFEVNGRRAFLWEEDILVRRFRVLFYALRAVSTLLIELHVEV